MRKLSLELEELINVVNPEGITFGELLDTLRLSGFGLLFVVLSLPSALPIPAPGYSTPFAVVIILLALQIIAGRSSPIIPQRVHGRKISAKTIARIEKRGIPLVRLVERFSKPRFEILSQGRTFGLLLGIVILIVAIVMAIPIPFTNTVFAGAILLIGIGLVNNDGLFILGGGLIGLMAVAAVIALLIVGGLALF
ncbi:MAG: exopolysaccharide biosynthesis protein [Chloroflexi bacterium]|nr:exopolysaccharide biosynthesis protein [Chloroflexota bacterium]